jgi:hypothetical protein
LEKKQKTFISAFHTRAEVFCFFFSKKELLPYFSQLPRDHFPEILVLQKQRRIVSRQVAPFEI